MGAKWLAVVSDRGQGPCKMENIPGHLQTSSGQDGLKVGFRKTSPPGNLRNNYHPLHCCTGAIEGKASGVHTLFFHL